MKNILIVWALSQEIKAIKKKIKDLKFKNLNFSFLATWMGNYNMILNLTKYLEKDRPDFVLNIWVCWYKSEYKDFFQVSRIKNIADDKELIIPNIIEFWSLESLLCSEKVVFDDKTLWDESYVDMESYGFEKVCDSYLLPRLILKVPVDKLWEETKNFDYKKAISFLENKIDYEMLLWKIDSYLLNIKYENKDLDKYNDFFNFSFTQKLIFEKLYNKYEVLTWEYFYDYFYKYIRSLEKIQNKKIESKLFLEKLEQYLEDK